MPHPGLLLFGACAVVAVAVVVIEEWPTIKETYREVRSRRRRRMSVSPHQVYTPPSQHGLAAEEPAMAASGIHEPLQEMTMRSRNNDGKLGIQVMRPFAPTPLENSFAEHAAMEETLIPSIQREESPARFPIFTEDVSPLINRTASPFNPVVMSPPFSPLPMEHSDIAQHIASSEITLQQPSPEDLINPLDRSSSPAPQIPLENPFTDPTDTAFDLSADPSESHYEDAESSPMSRTSTRTLSLGSVRSAPDDMDEINSMSDWTEAFDNNTDTEGLTDVDSDSDVVSDAESEASWARVRSRGVGYH